ncbi:hypothetical protein NUW54_g11234 [Trametes sanguinea]|uniref:Uncharacterized protein n=1 Tax=Trametes sanguinea TaxID=158606 RepID=A0ACC1NJX7_9APHY|nr:hypothetical protein NUW54_g11234 [Trametes sanguinea]
MPIRVHIQHTSLQIQIQPQAPPSRSPTPESACPPSISGTQQTGASPSRSLPNPATSIPLPSPSPINLRSPLSHPDHHPASFCPFFFLSPSRPSPFLPARLALCLSITREFPIAFPFISPFSGNPFSHEAASVQVHVTLLRCMSQKRQFPSMLGM